jgi:hypothetical protein
MAGHEDGIVVFGPDFRQVLATLAAAYPEANRTECVSVKRE